MRNPGAGTVWLAASFQNFEIGGFVLVGLMILVFAVLAMRSPATTEAPSVAISLPDIPSPASVAPRQQRPVFHSPVARPAPQVVTVQEPAPVRGAIVPEPAHRDHVRLHNLSRQVDAVIEADERARIYRMYSSRSSYSSSFSLVRHGPR